MLEEFIRYSSIQIRYLFKDLRIFSKLLYTLNDIYTKLRMFRYATHIERNIFKSHILCMFFGSLLAKYY